MGLVESVVNWNCVLKVPEVREASLQPSCE